jgi:hypothetical protein
MIVSLTPETEAWGVYPGGQSGNPGSKYYDNFIDTWVAGKYYTIWVMKQSEEKDAKVKWKDVLIGGLITSVFFTLGKLTIGYYLGSSNIASVYGAAGSIMIIMVWVYYSSIILYLGAEFTKVYAKLHGGKIYPNEYAIWIKTEETQVANPVLKNKVLD